MDIQKRAKSINLRPVNCCATCESCIGWSDGMRCNRSGNRIRPYTICDFFKASDRVPAIKNADQQAVAHDPDSGVNSDAAGRGGVPSNQSQQADVNRIGLGG
jgi:hypothetical protein